MKYFTNCKNENEVKTQYRKLALQNHPDRGGDTAIMAAINKEYEEALKTVGQKGFTISQKVTDKWQDIDEGFRAVIEKLIVIDDIVIELCGNWLWISGDTFPHKAEIKAAGCYWARKKSMWYWRPASYKCHTRRTRSMDEIREKYGSSRIVRDERKKITA